MKKILSIAAALMLSISAFAEDYSLYYDSTNGTTNSVLSEVSKLQKLTFENGNVVLTYKDGTTSSTAISDIKRLFFSTPETVGISEVEEESISANAKGVYDLTGRKLNVDIKSNKLPKGIYIVDGKKVLVK
ncbi:MAG: hypothetical protein K6E54_02140 [Bacteroidaceae bacterium]|nr:hypothetical protein [Bacteroidaceae bacterium]